MFLDNRAAAGPPGRHREAEHQGRRQQGQGQHRLAVAGGQAQNRKQGRFIIGSTLIYNWEHIDL